MSERLYLKSADVLNLGPFEKARAEFGPGGCIFSGENATGKSSWLNILNFCLEGGSAQGLVRHGPNGEVICESGEVTLTFSDGATYWKQQKLPENQGEKGEVKSKVLGPQKEIKKREAEWLSERIPKRSFSVAGFLESSNEDQAEWLIRHIDLSFTAEEVNALLETTVGRLPNSEVVFGPVSGIIPLTKFNEIYDTIYDGRRQINVQARNLGGVIEDLRKGLPPASDTDWSIQRDSILDQITAIDKDLAAKESGIKLEAEQARSTERNKIESEIQGQRDFIAAYAALVDAFAAGVRSYSKCELEKCPIKDLIGFQDFVNAVVTVRTLRSNLEDFLRAVDYQEAEAIREQTLELSQKRAKLSLDLGSAKSNADREQQSIGTREAINKRLQESKGLTTREMRRSAILDAMEQAKHLRLKAVPIAGLDVKFDSRKRPVISVNGTPIEQLSGQEKIYLCVQCIQLGCGSVPLIILEGAELTETYLDLLVESCRTAEPPIQLFASFRVKEKPLTVEALA